MRVLVVMGLTAVTTGCSFLGSAPFRNTATAAGPRLTHAAFVSRAEIACSRRARGLAALQRPRTNGERRAFFTGVAKVMRTETLGLAVLVPPQRDELEFKRLLVASGKLAAVSERFVAALPRSKAGERRRAVADADHAGEAYDRAARRLGLRCRQST